MTTWHCSVRVALLVVGSAEAESLLKILLMSKMSSVTGKPNFGYWDIRGVSFRRFL